jgi:hypothetical protein
VAAAVSVAVAGTSLRRVGCGRYTDDVKRALAKVPGRIVDAHPVSYGLTIF